MNTRVVYVDALFDTKVSDLAERSLRLTLDKNARQNHRSLDFERVRIAGPGAYDPKDFAKLALQLQPRLIILSGSEKNISDYAQDTWVQSYCHSLRHLTDSLRKAHGQPQAFSLFGICFGHQALSYVHGARVQKVGISVGLMECYPLDAPQSPFYESRTGHRSVPLISYHGDQVIDLPSGFVRTFYSKHCNIQGLIHKNYPIMTIQSHPEFTSEIVQREKWKHCKKSVLEKHEGFEFLEKVYRWAKLNNKDSTQ